MPKCEDCKNKETQKQACPPCPPCLSCIHNPYCRNDNFVRAAPKVLSAEEWIRNTLDYENALHVYPSSEIFAQDAFINGDQNGQLREWLRPEQVELRKSLEKVVEYYDKYKNANPQMTMISFDPHIIKRIYEAVIDIKPPKSS